MDKNNPDIKNNKLTDDHIKRALLGSIKYVVANIITSVSIIAIQFFITLLIGFDDAHSLSVLSGYAVQTVMLPLVVWYFAYLAYSDGYKHAVAETYNPKQILLSAVPMLVIQILFISAAVSTYIPNTDQRPEFIIARFLLAPYEILFQNFDYLMPELMYLPCAIAPIAMYYGYKHARVQEESDHAIKDDAKQFREELGQEYERKKILSEADKEKRNAYINTNDNKDKER